MPVELIIRCAPGLDEEGQELILRDTTCALLGAIYVDSGIAAVSAFAATHVFPALLRLRDTVSEVQPNNPLDRLNSCLKGAHLLPYFRTVQVVNEGTPDAEYVVALSVGGIEMSRGRATSSATARISAAALALANPALVSLLPAAGKQQVQEFLALTSHRPSKALSSALRDVPGLPAQAAAASLTGRAGAQRPPGGIVSNAPPAALPSAKNTTL